MRMKLDHFRSMLTLHSAIPLSNEQKKKKKTVYQSSTPMAQMARVSGRRMLCCLRVFTKAGGLGGKRGLVHVEEPREVPARQRPGLGAQDLASTMRVRPSTKWDETTLTKQGIFWRPRAVSGNDVI